MADKARSGAAGVRRAETSVAGPGDVGEGTVVRRKTEAVARPAATRPSGSRARTAPADAAADPPTGAPALGHVTSSYFSPTLGRTFAMALVAGGRARIGATIYATTMEGTAPARIVEPVFYDREGRRLDA